MDTDYTFIYQIKCKDPNITESYIGSTRHFGQRLTSHKHNCKKNMGSKLYQFINKNGGWDNWEMIMLESPFCSKREAFLLEKQYVQNYNCTLNSNVVIREKEDILEYSRKYKEKHKEKINLYMKIYMRTYK